MRYLSLNSAVSVGAQPRAAVATVESSESPGQASRILLGASVIVWHVYAILIFPWISSDALAVEWLVVDLVVRSFVIIVVLASGVVAFLICRGASWPRRIISCCVFTFCHAGILFAAYVSLTVLGGLRPRIVGPLMTPTDVSSAGGAVLAVLIAVFGMVAITSMLIAWNSVRNRSRVANITAVVIGPLMAVLGFILPIPLMLTRPAQVPVFESILFQLLWIVLWCVAFCMLSMAGDRERGARAEAHLAITSAPSAGGYAETEVPSAELAGQSRSSSKVDSVGPAESPKSTRRTRRHRRSVFR